MNPEKIKLDSANATSEGSEVAKDEVGSRVAKSGPYELRTEYSGGRPVYWIQDTRTGRRLPNNFPRRSGAVEFIASQNRDWIHGYGEAIREINAAAESIGGQFEVLPDSVQPPHHWPWLVRWGSIGGALTGDTFTEALLSATRAETPDLATHDAGSAMGRPPRTYTVEDLGYDTPCWIYLPTNGQKGYASIQRDGRKYRAHRWHYEQVHGPIPDGLQLDHLCRVRNCANPDHMEVVTNAENSRRGSTTKLTEAQVIEIRKRSAEGSVALAEEFGVSRQTISDIKAGRKWKDVSPTDKNTPEFYPEKVRELVLAAERLLNWGPPYECTWAAARKRLTAALQALEPEEEKRWRYEGRCVLDGDKPVFNALDQMEALAATATLNDYESKLSEGE